MNFARALFSVLCTKLWPSMHSILYTSMYDLYGSLSISYFTCIGFHNRGNKRILFHPNVLECWIGSVHFHLTAGMLLGVQNHPDTVIKLDLKY